VALAAVAAGAALAETACGAGIMGAPAVAGSYATTLAAKTADVALTTAVTVGGLTLTNINASGVIDYGHRASDIRFGSGRQPGDEAIRVGGDLYSTEPGPVEAAVTWLRQPLDRAQIDSTPSNDPTVDLSYLQHISQPA
jgi:hypothetical protein